MYDTPPQRRRFAEPLHWAILASLLLHGLILALRFGSASGGAAPETTSPEPLRIVLNDAPPLPNLVPPPPQDDLTNTPGAPLSTATSPPGELSVTLLRLPAHEAVAEQAPSDATAERKAGRKRARSPVMTAKQGNWRAAQGEHSGEKQPDALADASVGKANIIVPKDTSAEADATPALGNPDVINNTPEAEARQEARDTAAAARSEALEQAEKARHKAEEVALAEATAKREAEAAARAEQAAKALHLAEQAAEETRQAEQLAAARKAAELQAAAERLKADEATRLQAARLAADAAAKKQAEELARQEQEKRARELQLAADKARAEEQARQEQARQVAELQARQKAEEVARLDQQRHQQEQQAAAERQKAEEVARAEQARQAADAARKQAEAAAQAELARKQAAIASNTAPGNGTGSGTSNQTGPASNGAGTTPGAGIPLPFAPPAGLSLAERALQQARQSGVLAAEKPQPPRGRTATFSQSAAAAEPDLRFYAESWNIKLERIGSLNKPRLSPDRFYRPVTLSIVINADGSVYSIGVRHSSGDEKLDEAARRIVLASSPFAPFPNGMRGRYDQVEIHRTWDFGAGTTSLAN